MVSRVRFKRPHAAKCTRSGCEKMVTVSDPAFAAGEIRYSLDWVKGEVDQRAAYEWLYRSMHRLLEQLQFGLCVDCARKEDVVVQPATSCNACVAEAEVSKRLKRRSALAAGEPRPAAADPSDEGGA